MFASSGCLPILLLPVTSGLLPFLQFATLAGIHLHENSGAVGGFEGPLIPTYMASRTRNNSEDNLGELAAMTPKRETNHFYPVNGPRRSGHGFIPAVPIDSGLENQAYSYEGHSRRYMPQRFTTRREPSEEILLNDVKPTSDNFFNRPV